MSRCAICARPYRLRSNGSNGYCQQCKRLVEREQSRCQQHKARRSWRFRLYKVIRHKGRLVGFYEKPGQPDHLEPRAVTVSVRSVPKCLLIDLDTYCPGFNREQVKRMKRVVAQVHGQ